MNKLPESITSTLYISQCTEGYSAGEICIWDRDMSEHGYAVLGTHEITLPIPQVDVTEKHIAALEKRRQEIFDAASAKADAIQNQINILQPIEHREESS